MSAENAGVASQFLFPTGALTAQQGVPGVIREAWTQGITREVAQRPGDVLEVGACSPPGLRDAVTVWHAQA